MGNTSEANRQLDCFEAARYRHDCPDGHALCCIPTDTVSYRRRGPKKAWQIVVERALPACLLLCSCCVCCYIALTRSRIKLAAAPPPITRLQIEEIFPEKAIDGQPQCVICLLEIIAQGRQLECGHSFHSNCIMEWWTYVPRAELQCPTCKRVQSLPAQTSLPESVISHSAAASAQDNHVLAEVVGQQIEETSV